MPTPTSLTAEAHRSLVERLRPASARLARRYPGEPEGRQPLHTVYGGAHLFRPDTAAKLGTLARRALEAYGPDAETFGSAIELAGDRDFRAHIYARVIAKLEREPVEDFRIDFEDGYGTRPDEEEDATALACGTALADGLAAGTLPPFIGIRIKPLSIECAGRALRTLDLVLTTLARASGGALPSPFVVTLPKIMDAEQSRVLAAALDAIERANGLAAGAVRTELMVETPPSILGPDGRSPLLDFVDAADGRCVAAHFGVYDYTAGCSITAAHQEMAHPCCDFARHVMQVQLAGTGLWLSDGATNILPVGPHARPADADEAAANRTIVHRAWKRHADDVRRSLRHGFYQGWDLHPAQLPTRYAVAYEFFLRSLDHAAARLRHFVDQAARATLAGDVFDDAATGQGLLNFFLRGVSCGAIQPEEAEACGLAADELRLRSFSRILARRRQAPH